MGIKLRITCGILPTSVLFYYRRETIDMTVLVRFSIADAMACRGQMVSPPDTKENRRFLSQHFREIYQHKYCYMYLKQIAAVLGSPKKIDHLHTTETRNTGTRGGNVWPRKMWRKQERVGSNKTAH